MQDLLMIGAVSLLAYWFIKYKHDVKHEIMLAAVISFIWAKVSSFYVYGNGNRYFLGVNLFPFIAWTAGLVILKEWYESVNWKNKFQKISILYVIIVLALEWISYNYASIQISSSYGGLLGTDMLHSPLWAQIFYLSIGPIYLKLTERFKIR